MDKPKKTMQKYKFPINPPYRITQKFGENKLDYSKFGLKGHNGIDVAVPRGTPIITPFNGEVFEVVDNIPAGGKGYGNFIRIKVADNGRFYHWTFAHMLPDTGYRVGHRVYKGERLALVNSTGYSTGDHLHFGVREVTESGSVVDYGNGYLGYIDPMPFFEQVEDEVYPVDMLYHQKESMTREVAWKVVHEKYAKKRAAEAGIRWSDRFMKAFVYGYWDANFVFERANVQTWRNMTKPEYLKRLGRI